MNKRNQIEYHRQWRLANPGYYSQYQRQWRLANPGRGYIYRKKWREANPEKESSQKKIRSAIKAGIIIRPIDCEKCNVSTITHAHHDDYSKPFHVRFLCQQCHSDWHRINGEASGYSKQQQLQLNW